ncbi:MAG: tripartite tricarboxylate transporter permease [Candidatus Nanoarchaeia archaeon]|nr:tripartite tricarboxylate transporter permease [Candidatus Nanoarchaeia archaeon]MDD5239309.1 tripartite tricarboxylate transporter permease [Candidatus Nanoarchaeia archaeon]
MIDFAIAVFFGLLFGALAGIVPGMHANFIGALILAGTVGPYSLVSIIIMLVSSQFFEILRAVFLFVPEEGNVLAMHPIFKFVSEGKALVVLKLSLLGLVIAMLLGVILSPALIFIMPPVFMFAKDYAVFFLAIIAAFLILTDEHKFFALLIFALAGLVGWFGLAMLNQPLLILLTGFFGVPLLFEAKAHMPKQMMLESTFVDKKSIARGIGAAGLSSLLLTFIPAVGPAQASVFTRSIMKNVEEFFVAIGALSGFDTVFSMILLYAVGKARIGVLEQAGNFFTFDFQTLVLALVITFLVSILSYVVVLRLGKFFVKHIETVNYRWVGIGVLVLICGASIFFDGALGIFFLAAAAGVGWLANKLQTKMSHCMGSLMIPTMINLIF